MSPQMDVIKARTIKQTGMFTKSLQFKDIQNIRRGTATKAQTNRAHSQYRCEEKRRRMLKVDRFLNYPKKLVFS